MTIASLVEVVERGEERVSRTDSIDCSSMIVDSLSNDVCMIKLQLNNCLVHPAPFSGSKGKRDLNSRVVLLHIIPMSLLL